MEFLSEFEFDIKHIKGKEKKIEDALRKHAYNLMEKSTSSTNTDFIEDIRNSITSDTKYLEIQ